MNEEAIRITLCYAAAPSRTFDLIQTLAVAASLTLASGLQCSKRFILNDTIWAVRLITDFDRQFLFEKRQRLFENILQVTGCRRFEVG